MAAASRALRLLSDFGERSIDLPIQRANNSSRMRILKLHRFSDAHDSLVCDRRRLNIRHR